MEIPTPNEYANKHGFTPFPPVWERFLNAVRVGILTAQGIAGHNVSIDVYKGEGTVYNISGRDREPIRGGGGGGGVGACCYGDWPSLVCTEISEADCDALEGSYRGDGTACDDTDCSVGACCRDFPSVGNECFETEEFICPPVNWHGYGTTCADESIRCEGACCIIPEVTCDGCADCSQCYENLTYTECDTLRSECGSCSSSWTIRAECGGSNMWGQRDFCCLSFPCPDCYPSGNCCCVGGLCGSASDQENCDAICDPVGGTFQGYLPCDQQCATCEQGDTCATCGGECGGEFMSISNDPFFVRN